MNEFAYPTGCRSIPATSVYAHGTYATSRTTTAVFHSRITGRVVARGRAVAPVANSAQVLFLSVESSKLIIAPATTNAYIASSRPPERPFAATDTVGYIPDNIPVGRADHGGDAWQLLKLSSQELDKRLRKDLSLCVSDRKERSSWYEANWISFVSLIWSPRIDNEDALPP